jgi:probable F420-dependent oxidoreductase
MRLCLTLPTMGELRDTSLDYVVEAGQAAEAHGVDVLVVPEHVVMGSTFEEYQWGLPRGRGDVPYLEPLTTLAALSSVTSRVRLATGLLIAPLRPAAVLAKGVASVDVLSRGRVELGVGTGWQSVEFDAVGVPYEQRGALMTDRIAACRALWTDAPASYRSEWTSFDEVWCEPRPVQVGGPPVLFGGTLNERMADRIVTLGNGWLPIMGSSIDDIGRGVATLRERFTDAGRDPDRLIVRTRIPLQRDDEGRPSIVRTLAAVPGYRDAGLTDVVVMLGAFTRARADVEPWLEKLQEAWTAVTA